MFLKFLNCKEEWREEGLRIILDRIESLFLPKTGYGPPSLIIIPNMPLRLQFTKTKVFFFIC
jgi:hypothetical protein